MAFPIFTTITCILVLILIITSALAIVYFIGRNEAQAYASPWCWSWQCSGTGYDPTAAFVAVIDACKVDPATGKVNTAKCNCAEAGWANFYDPSNPNNYSNPPANPPPNNCLT